MTNRKPKERRRKVQLINAVDLFTKMRKSLGNKRNEIGDAQRKEIVGVYRAFVENERSKIFDNDDFGFHQITVERPLRLNFATSPERIERLKAERAFLNLASSKKKGKAAEKEIAEGEAIQQRLLEALSTLGAREVWRDRAAFEPILEDAVSSHEVKLTAPLRKALLSALGERDETAEICRDVDGNPEPDSELRDYENVPLKEDIHEYFEREVRPYLPDAWVDEEKTKVGYEIPLTRHFYKYTSATAVGGYPGRDRGVGEGDHGDASGGGGVTIRSKALAHQLAGPNSLGWSEGRLKRSIACRPKNGV